MTRFQFIDEHRQSLSLRILCKLLAVSRSGYYQWRLGCDHPSVRLQTQQQRNFAIKQAFIQSKGRDGARRIQAE